MILKLKKQIVVLDLETTGTWIEKDKIIEIGMVKCDPNGAQETFVQRVNPGISIPKEVTEVTRISNEDVKNAPFFKEIAGQVLKFIGDADLAGFNIIKFDIPILKREIHDIGLELKLSGRNIFDSKVIYHVNEKRDLTAAYKFYCKKELKDAHSALADASATLEVLQGQIKMYGNDTGELESLSKFSYVPKIDFVDEERKLRFWNGDYYLTFGKYRNRGLKEILEIEGSYLSWLASTDLNEKAKTVIIQALNSQKKP